MKDVTTRSSSHSSSPRHLQCGEIETCCLSQPMISPPGENYYVFRPINILYTGIPKQFFVVFLQHTCLSIVLFLCLLIGCPQQYHHSYEYWICHLSRSYFISSNEIWRRHVGSCHVCLLNTMIQIPDILAVRNSYKTSRPFKLYTH